MAYIKKRKIATKSKTRGRRVYKRRRTGGLSAAVARQGRLVRQIWSTIETKEATRSTAASVGFYHNNVGVIQDSAGGTFLNPFLITQGTADPMTGSAGARIGDTISVKGLLIKGFFENSLDRARVYYRFMLIKCAKGDTVDRTTLFKGDSANKMIDQVNTERFQIIAQKVFTIDCTNNAPHGLAVGGYPSTGTAAGIGTRVFKMWIPGRKFGKYGRVQFENGAAQQLKFYDYKMCLVVYDWYGTPQDINIVGQINELYTKVYFKDA